MSRDPRVEQEELGKAITPQVTHHRGWENQRSLDVAFNSTPPMS